MGLLLDPDDFGGDCPDILTGENCSQTWKEEWDPWASGIRYAMLALYGTEFVFCFFMLLVTVYNSRLRSNTGLGLRTKTLFFGCLATSLWFVFHYYEANLAFGLDTYEGKICMSSLLLANVFTLQSASFLIAMYVFVLNSQLNRDKGFMDNLKVKTISRLASHWPIQIVNTAITVLIFLEVTDVQPMDWVRIQFGIILIPLLMNIYLGNKYLLTLHNRIEEGENNVGKVRSDASKQWHRLAVKSRLLSYYFCGGYLVAATILVLIITPVLHASVYYFAFVSVNAIWNSLYFLQFVNLLKRREIFSQKTLEEVQDFGKRVESVVEKVGRRVSTIMQSSSLLGRTPSSRISTISDRQGSTASLGLRLSSASIGHEKGRQYSLKPVDSKKISMISEDDDNDEV